MKQEIIPLKKYSKNKLMSKKHKRVCTTLNYCTTLCTVI